MRDSDDIHVARHLALAAGELLLAGRDAVRSAGATAIDEDADQLVAGLLSTLRPADAVLSEELGGSGNRATAERVWIIDPLDGTREYNEAGRTDWAVHIALWQSGELAAAAVALPAREQLFTTSDEVPVAADRPIRRIAVSRSRPPAWAVSVAQEYGAELVPMGSAGVKTLAVVTGEVDAYLHDGGQYEWDSAAPVAIARHHGLHTSRADGSALRYNQPHPWSPDLVVCPAAQAERLLEAISRFRQPAEVGAGAPA